MYLDYNIKVRYAETDMMGVVYHANYLLYFEDARTSFLRDIGFPYEDMEEQGFQAPLLSCELHYRKPLKYGDTAVLRVCISKSTRTRTVFTYFVYKLEDEINYDDPYVWGITEHCTVSNKDFKPINFKKIFPEAFAKYQEVLESPNLP
ncbi:MAG: acyl-CoA thioesterase [Eggerthellaceae bacterium]|jgi:acyl-CoA thioester hydrolase